MEQQVTRPRGRPKGSSRYKTSDPRYLREVAQKLLANPNLSLRAAITQVVIAFNVLPNRESAVRRLQEKFQPREVWMEQAREEQRRKEKQAQERREFVSNMAALPGQLHTLASLGVRSSAVAEITKSMTALNEKIERIGKVLNPSVGAIANIQSLGERIAAVSLAGERITKALEPYSRLQITLDSLRLKR